MGPAQAALDPAAQQFLHDFLIHSLTAHNIPFVDDAPTQASLPGAMDQRAAAANDLCGSERAFENVSAAPSADVAGAIVGAEEAEEFQDSEEEAGLGVAAW